MLEYLPPRIERAVTIDGFECPRIEASETSDGKTCNIVLDGRFGASIRAEDAHQVIWLLANALAIGEGYSCHGENSQRLNRYKVGVYEIEVLDTGK